MSKLKTILNTKTLKSSAREAIYTKLLRGNYEAQLTLLSKRGPITVNVEFMRNDLCISSWLHNFYFRTAKAVKFERYKTLGCALAALRELVTNRIGTKCMSDLRIYFRGEHIFSLKL